MWGSIGFGIFGISAGYLVDMFSEGQFQKDYTCIFFMMLVFMILDIIMSARLRKVRLKLHGFILQKQNSAYLSKESKIGR